MLLRARAEQVPTELSEAIASLTDGATLRWSDVEYDRQTGRVRFTVTRFPLLKERLVLPNLRDREHPIPSVVTVRNVIACEIEDYTTPKLGKEVHLLFGVQARTGRVFACSAEENKGRPCYSVTIEVAELDIEIAGLANDAEAIGNNRR